MSEKLRGVKRPEQAPEPSRAARHKRGEPRHRAGPQRLILTEIAVQAEAHLRAPGTFEAIASALCPPGDLCAFVVWRADSFRYLQERLVGGNQDGGKEHVLYQKRVRVVDDLFVATGALYQLDEPEVAVVLGVGGTVGGIGDVLEILALVRRQVPDLDGL